MNDIVVMFIPATKWYKKSKWKLMNHYTSVNKEVTVPVGYVTDGASIPSFLSMFFSPTGKYFGAAIVHDYVISEEKNWGRANDQFNKELKALGIAKWRRNILLWGVKFWRGVLKLIGVNSADEI